MPARWPTDAPVSRRKSSTMRLQVSCCRICSGQRLGAEAVGLLSDPQRLGLAAMSRESQRRVREKLNWRKIGNAIADKIEALPIFAASQPDADKCTIESPEPRRRAGTS
jgi:hypothetical protein